MSNTGKQQFTVNQSIYLPSDKDCSVLDDIDAWRSVWTGSAYDNIIEQTGVLLTP